MVRFAICKSTLIVIFLFILKTNYIFFDTWELGKRDYLESGGKFTFYEEVFIDFIK